jgi:hypothetical protein
MGDTSRFPNQPHDQGARRWAPEPPEPEIHLDSSSCDLRVSQELSETAPSLVKLEDRKGFKQMIVLGAELSDHDRTHPTRRSTVGLQASLFQQELRAWALSSGSFGGHQLVPPSMCPSSQKAMELDECCS